MGEAKRRRAALAATARQRRRLAEQARARWAEIEDLASEDPDDRACRLAHGFTRDDDWHDPTVVCRNGCGLPYAEVVAGKIRDCAAASPDGNVVAVSGDGRWPDDDVWDRCLCTAEDCEDRRLYVTTVYDPQLGALAEVTDRHGRRFYGVDIIPAPDRLPDPPGGVDQVGL